MLENVCFRHPQQLLTPRVTLEGFDAVAASRRPAPSRPPPSANGSEKLMWRARAVRWRLTPPRSLAGEGHTTQNEGSSRPSTTKRGKTLDAFALIPQIGQ